MKLVKIFKILIFLNVNGFVLYRFIVYYMILKDIYDCINKFKFINYFFLG